MSGDQISELELNVEKHKDELDEAVRAAKDAANNKEEVKELRAQVFLYRSRA